MTPPGLLLLSSETEYRAHYLRAYCRSVIRTFDGIRVYFHENRYGHAFYESSRRDGRKDRFCRERAERMNWIKATLEHPDAELYQGWDKETKTYAEARRVSVVFEDYIVVIEISQNRSGQQKANFITAYKAGDDIAKVRRGPKWVRPGTATEP